MPEMLPYFLIIGAARSGTSWLAQNLMDHPDIYMPAQKELHFFDRDFEKGMQFYKQYFNGTNHHQICGEATPAYLYFEHIPQLIKEYLPNVKLLAILRNPVDRAFSHYLNIQARVKGNGKEMIRSFEEEIKVNERLIYEGFYYEMLQRYYKLFSATNILVLIYEDVVSQPEKYIKNVYHFLNVTENHIPKLLNQRVNAASTKLGQSKSLYFLYRLFMKKLKWYGVAKKVNEYNKPQLPAINTKTREYLNNLYLEKNKLLEDLIGQHIESWSINIDF